MNEKRRSLSERIAAAVREEIAVVAYDADWPRRFEEEAARLRARLPGALLGRIEHFGSTAVPGLAAKPIVDMLVEVSSLEAARREIVPLLEADGYDYFWRPLFDVDEPPYYAWFIRRDAAGRRTHHIHMVEADSVLWERLAFRDRLRASPETARRYAELKRELAARFPGDRVAYTKGKTEFIAGVMNG